MLQGSPAYKRRAGILKVCQKHAGGKTYVKSMSKACQKYVKSVTKVCQKYAGACYTLYAGACYTLHAGARRQATPAYYACNACILCLQRLHTITRAGILLKFRVLLVFEDSGGWATG
jgi:hypothetical protein